MLNSIDNVINDNNDIININNKIIFDILQYKYI